MTEQLSTPDLADWLRSLTPEQVRAVNALAPGHEADQQAALARDMHGILADPATGGVLRQLSGVGDLPEPLLWSVLEEIRGLMTRTGRTCAHVPPPGRAHTMPLLAAMWRPGFVVCAHCPHLLLPPRGTEHTCDFCGRDDSTSQPHTLQWSTLLYSYSDCAGCREAHR